MNSPAHARSDDEFLLELMQRLDERSCLPLRLLGALVAGTLSAPDAAEMHAHLRSCLACLQAFARLQSLHESLPPGEGQATRVVQQASESQANRMPEPPVRLVGDSDSLRALRAQMIRLAALDRGPGLAPPVLITGESGTGKGVVAREIHAASRRASRPFIEVGCASLPASELEEKLFGPEGDAVPDSTATATMSGLVEAADGGTLFLDVIDRMTLELQLRVLEVLEQCSVRRRGGIESRRLDVRIIAATHVDLDDAVRRGAFRADLLDRLKVGRLALPPLRDRPDDIVPLARFFVGQFARHHGGAPRLTDNAEEQLRRYQWPGNVRELSNVIERAAKRRAHEEIGAEELGLPAG